MKRNKTAGTAIIEFNHGGIPDDELKPEEFSEYQLAVLNSLPVERQEPIRRGCPVKVIDMATGNEIASFNMNNVEPTEFQKQMLARALYECELPSRLTLNSIFTAQKPVKILENRPK